MSSTTSESLKASRPQPLVLPPSRTLIRAGAGAGKTTELISRVLGQIIYFQKNHDRDPRLVVTTFTRKATQEIRERLLVAAQDWGDPRVLRYVQTSPFLSIATIHASLQKYLNLYGNKIGLAPEYSFIGGSDLRRLEKKALRELLASPDMAEHFSALLEEWDISHFWEAFHLWSQQKVLTRDLKPLDRSQLLAIRQEQLIKVQHRRRELAQELESLELSGAWVEFLNLCKAPADLTFLDEIRLWERPPVTRINKKIPEDLNERKKDLVKMGQALGEWSYSDDFIETHERMSQIFPLISEELLKRFESEKRRRGQLAMADLENWSLRLARDFPESATAFSENWDFWMIDEYQDTSPLQVEILRRLIGAKPEFVVGDPQQSIYLFRGARSQVFLDKELEMEKTGSERLSKMTNYRSRPSLMGFINDLLPTMSSQFQEMEKNPNPWVGQYQGPEAILWTLPETEDKESLVIPALAQRISELLAAGEPPSSICILARTNREVSEFSEGLQKLGLAVYSHRPSIPSRRREIRDALSYLKFLVQPHDNQNLIELLRSPWFRVDDEILFSLAHSGSDSFWSRRRELKPSHAVLNQLEKDLDSVQFEGIFYRWLEGLKIRGLFDYSYVIDPSGQREANLWKLVSDLRWKERTPGFSYSQFVSDLLEQTAREDQVSDEVPAVVEPSRVQVMTIHASKGLEFGHVLMASMGDFSIKKKRTPIVVNEDQGLFSFSLKTKEREEWESFIWADDQMDSRKAREIEEYDRLLYVALTRAKGSLTLIWDQVKEGSWAARWPSWLPTAEGVFSIKDFSIEFRSQVPVESQFALEERQRARAIQPWINLDDLKTPEAKTLETASTWEGLQLISKGIETHHYLESLQENWDTLDVHPAGLREQLKLDTNVNFEYLIKNGFVEWGFIFESEGYLKQGRIDLWGRDEKGRAWIVDYKTGSPKYRDKAIQQLKDYAHALIQLKQVDPAEKIVLYPVYLSEGSKSYPEEYQC